MLKKRICHDGGRVVVVVVMYFNSHGLNGKNQQCFEQS